MTRSKLEKLITDFVIQHNLDASFVQQTEGLTYVRFVVEEDFQDDNYWNFRRVTQAVKDYSTW